MTDTTAPARNRDWFDFARADDRVREAERAMMPGPSLLPMGQFWGDGTNVICAGDAGHAARCAAKLRADRMMRVAHRLPIWC